MHRIYVLPLILLLGLTAVMAVAQEDPPPDDQPPAPVVVPDETVDEADDDLFNAFMSAGGGPLAINAGEGEDLCDDATAITVLPGGNQMDVAAMTQSPTDPNLGCMWGSPSSLQGYRTVWYKYTAEFNGVMRVSTLPASAQSNSYDTVVAIHTGSCGSLTTLACNDDKVGFSSEATVTIRRNTTYFIEVADWQAGGNAVKTLDLFVELVPFTSMWKDVSTNSFTFTSRHVSVVAGSNIYFLGGRNSAGNLLNNFQKLNTNTKTWSQLTPIPGGGFLNTTAVYLKETNDIYLPGGSIQTNDQAYSREHRIYDFDTGIWSNTGDFELVGGSAVTETFAYAAAAPNNANDGYFLTGGVIGPSFVFSSTVRDQVLFYQPDSDTWIARAPMGSPRYGHVAANVNGKLCVAGGLSTDGSQSVLVPDGECASGVSPSTWSPTGVMKVPRYFAHSSVSPGGKWYVYGGVDSNGSPVPEVEYYDPATNDWNLLGLSYDLFGQNIAQPGLVWPGGGFVGNYLWMAGGSYDPNGASPNSQVKRVQLLGGSLYLPIIMNQTNANNYTFAEAKYMSLGTAVSQNFSNPPLRNVNVYKFNNNQVSTIRVALTSIAPNAYVNLYLYGENKVLLQSSLAPPVGTEKTITIPLGAGTYYVMVKYTFSPNPDDINDYYNLRISRQ